VAPKKASSKAGGALVRDYNYISLEEPLKKLAQSLAESMRGTTSP
jgi:ABC-type sugar transport system ATPase subunit